MSAKIRVVKALTVAVSAVLVMTFFAACAAPTEEAPAEEPSAAEEAPAETEAEAEEKVFTFIDSLDWTNIDPRASTDNDQRIMFMIYETLTRYNVPGTSDEPVSPLLATSWEKNEDATEWTFHLREGVKFHDGTPFTAEAVKTSFEKIHEMYLGAAYLWDAITEIEVIDDLTIKFILEYPQPLDVMFSSAYQAWIISPAVIDATTEEFNTGEVQSGTGQWIMDEFVRDERAVFSRNDDYWGGWTDDQYDKIVLEYVEDPATIFQMIQSGEVDGAVGVLPEHVPLIEENPDYDVVVGTSFQSEHWELNVVDPPLDDVRVRQALSYAFPYEECIEAAEGLASPSRVGIPPGQIGHDPDAFQYTHDLGKARELLEEAGYADGFSITMNNFTYWTGATQACPLLWQTELAKLNIDLEIREIQYETAWAIAIGGPESGEAVQNVFRQLWWVAYPTAFDYLFAMYACQEPDARDYNLSYYCNEEFDNLILEANALEGIDPDEAQALYEEALAILVEDAPSIWPRDLQSVFVIKSNIEGFVPNPAYNAIYDFYQFTVQE